MSASDAKTKARGLHTIAAGPGAQATHPFSVCIGENAVSEAPYDVRVDPQFFRRWYSELSFDARITTVATLTRMVVDRTLYLDLGFKQCEEGLSVLRDLLRCVIDYEVSLPPVV